MEPQEVQQQTTVEPVVEDKKVEAEKAPVAVNWKKPLTSIVIIGALALGLMLLVKYL
ncbi:hypothetical protein GYA37_00610 [candidate division WWE3 bacterium]|uniref:Uncharacterized protein n=1 Tax=candidate division WWE3 bacterium TaxID=2053526 RepID=A0A7X9E6D5_UNCKA|nr:hypothetical protein [candidate division WWE3 bacterium]